jgi:hypothetical protein
VKGDAEDSVNRFHNAGSRIATVAMIAVACSIDVPFVDVICGRERGEENKYA